MDRLLPLACGIDAGHAVKADLDAVAHHRRPPAPAPVMPDATRRLSGTRRCGACRPVPAPRFAAAGSTTATGNKLGLATSLGLRPPPQILRQIALVDDLRPVEGPGLDRLHELQAAKHRLHALVIEVA